MKLIISFAAILAILVLSVACFAASPPGLKCAPGKEYTFKITNSAHTSGVQTAKRLALINRRA